MYLLTEPFLQNPDTENKTIISKNKLDLIQLKPPDEDTPVENCNGTWIRSYDLYWPISVFQNDNKSCDSAG